MTPEILVMIEQKDGVIEETSLSLLSEGKRLREKLGGLRLLSALIMGNGIKDLGGGLGAYGADRVYYFEDPRLDRYQPELYNKLIAELATEKKPDFFLLGATSLGGDLAPRIAARLRAGLVTQCVNLVVDRDEVTAVRPVSDQYLYEEVVFRTAGLKIVTFSPSAVTKEDPEVGKHAEVFRIAPRGDLGGGRVRFIEKIKADPKTIGLDEADFIICGGRGTGKEKYEIVHRLADALHGSIGGTRPIVDWGILPYERQIGQTGIEVFPTLLMTAGISGANEFTVGIEGSKLVIAINNDRKARIFKFADLGIIGDLHKILPLVIEEVTRRQKAVGRKQ